MVASFVALHNPAMKKFILRKPKLVQRLASAKARRLTARKPRAAPRTKPNLGASVRYSGISANSGVPSMLRSDRPISVVDSQIFTDMVTVDANLDSSVCSLLLAPSKFARMIALSRSYDQIRLESLSVTFIPFFGTSVPGLISMFFDYNDTALTPDVPFAQSLLATGSVSGPIYRPLTLRWRSQDHGDREFGSSASVTSFRTDNKLYGFHVATQLPNVSPNNYGYLIFHYKVSFKGLIATSTGVDPGKTSPASALKNSIGIPTLTMSSTNPTDHMNSTIQSLCLPK